jgi:hypothetical protein
VQRPPSLGVKAPGIKSAYRPTFSNPQPSKTRPNASGGRTFVTYSQPSGSGFQAALTQYKVQAATLQKNLARINEAAVRELSREASKELRRRIRARGRQQSRNQTLVQLASDYKANSSWSASGFHFFDPKVVRYSKAFPYYRAIELGSRHMVGRYIPLTFFRGGTQVPPPSVRYDQLINARRSQNRMGKLTSRGYVMKGQYNDKNVARARDLKQKENLDQLKDYGTYSGPNGTPYVVRIRNPIRPYYYISTAITTFRANNRYQEIMEGQVRKLAPLLARNLARRK